MIIGNKINLLTIIDIVSRKSGSIYKIKCKCDCGNIVELYYCNVMSGRSKDCGCVSSNQLKIIDFLGKRFGFLIVKNCYYIGNKLYAKCICDCGNEKDIYCGSLKGKKIKSCGCVRKYLKNALTHGFTSFGKRDRFYRIWTGILGRCNRKTDSGYYLYGGRGIKCEWNSFEEFRDDMYNAYCKFKDIYGVKNTTIERSDVDGNYCKKNCTWATWKHQANNRRNSNLYYKDTFL